MCPYLAGIVIPKKSLTAHNLPVLNSFIRIVMSILMEDRIRVGVNLELKTLKNIVFGALGLAQLLA
uniref:Uncharacterized protein n=1 Tax=Thermosporothrix sp. COM3 TaxID=2490863 RepID=A0A455SCU1_9CHLR|nr:hypothetical protein KTC_00510 [Thermosporothrix sp. COM3]